MFHGVESGRCNIMAVPSDVKSPQAFLVDFSQRCKTKSETEAWIGGYTISSYSEVVEELTYKSDNTCILASNVVGSADIGMWRSDVEVRYLQH